MLRLHKEKTIAHSRFNGHICMGERTSLESGDVSDDVFGRFFHEDGDGAAMAASEGANKVNGERIGDLVELAKRIVDGAVGGTKDGSVGGVTSLLTKDVVERTEFLPIVHRVQLLGATPVDCSRDK